MGLGEAYLVALITAGIGASIPKLLTQAMPQVSDYLFHGGQTGIFLVVAWYVVKKVNRDDSLKQDYPPHRHFNGSILYPKDYPPPETGQIGRHMK